MITLALHFKFMRQVTIFLFCILGVLLSGCDRQSVVDSTKKGGTIKILEADSNLVLAKLGTNVVTCGNFRERLDFEKELWKFRNPKKKDDKRALDSFCCQRLPRIIPELLNQLGVLSWMNFKGISFSSVEIQAAEREGLKNLGFKGDVRSFAKRLSCRPEFVSRQLCASARMRKACLNFDASVGIVSEKEIDDGLVRLQSYYNRAIASNAVTWVTCSNIIGKIQQGLPFAKAAEEFSYSDPEEGVKWGDFMMSTLENEKLKEWVGVCPIGTMRIFELDDGISIVKVLERTEGVSVRSGVRTKDVEVSLARINLAMVEPEPEPRTREYVRTALLKWKMGKAQRRLGDAIAEKFPITYPDEDAKIVLK